MQHSNKVTKLKSFLSQFITNISLLILINSTITVGPTDAKINLPNCWWVIHNNVVQISGQRRAIIPDVCAKHDTPPVLQTKYKEFEKICFPFHVNSEIFTVNEAYEMLSLNELKVRSKLIDHFKKEKYTPIG